MMKTKRKTCWKTKYAELTRRYLLLLEETAEDMEVMHNTLRINRVATELSRWRMNRKRVI